jgi:hypothetical protein
MAKHKRERQSVEWEVIRLQASPAKFIGYVRARDEETAREVAIERYQNTTLAATIGSNPKGLCWR